MFRTFRHVGNVMSSDETSYSKAMNSLANQVWERGDDSSASDSSQSRIEWIRRHLVKYHFENDRQRFQERMERKLFHLTSESMAEETKSTIATDPGARISVLDVGSCYNPFAKFPEFDVVAIDLSPTPDSDVYRCDFVSVGVGDRVDDIGVDNVTFETDYPHSDSTWPHTEQFVREMAVDLDDETLYKIVRGNAIKMLHLDLV